MQAPAGGNRKSAGGRQVQAATGAQPAAQLNLTRSERPPPAFSDDIERHKQELRREGGRRDAMFNSFQSAASLAGFVQAALPFAQPKTEAWASYLTRARVHAVVTDGRSGGAGAAAGREVNLAARSAGDAAQYRAAKTQNANKSSNYFAHASPPAPCLLELKPPPEKPPPRETSGRSSRRAKTCVRRGCGTALACVAAQPLC
jgi:hypothetical protein